MLMRTLNWLHGGHKPCDNLWCSRHLLLLLRLLLNTWEIFVVYKNQKKAGTRRHRRDRKCGIPSIRLVFRNDNESRRTWCNRIAYNEVIFPLHTRARLEYKLTSELANANSNRAHSNQLKRSSKLAHVMAADCVRYKLGLLQLNKFRFHRDPPSRSVGVGAASVNARNEVEHTVAGGGKTRFACIVHVPRLRWKRSKNVAKMIFLFYF